MVARPEVLRAGTDQLHSMFFQLLFIHLFRPFLKYTQATSPLPANVSPRKLCTQAAAMISKLMRLYKRSYGLRQICNIAVYIAHSACTIHLLNLPDKNAKRDIVHGVKHLEEIAEGWLGARRSLAIINILARKWKVELPEDATTVLARTEAKFGTVVDEIQSPSTQAGNERRLSDVSMVSPAQQPMPVQAWQQQGQMPVATAFGDTSLTRPSVSSSGTSIAPALPRTASISFKPPPQDAHSMRPQQYPSTATTPQTRPARNWASASSTATNSNSPSDMFGGVEQLIRDSQDWAYRDQAQIAAGFENWNQIDTGASSYTQPQGATNPGMQMPTVQNHAPMPTQHANGAYVTYPSAAPAVNASSPQTVNDLEMTAWLSSMNTYNNMAGAYDETEWYQ